MNKYYKYVIFGVSALMIALAIWYFQSIIAYILVSAVLSLIGAPVVNLLGKLHIGRFSLPKWVSAAITLALLWALFIAFFEIFVPVIAVEAQKISTIDSKTVMSAVEGPVTRIDAMVNQLFVHRGKAFSTMDLLSNKVQSVLDIGLFTDIFGSLATTLTNLFIAFFSITFITFFFLKDEGLFNQGVMLLVPTQYEQPARRVLSSTKDLLMRYFIGIGVQTLAMIIVTTIGLMLIGIDVQTSMVIALFMGIMNVIPYVGKLIGTMFGIIVGVASKLTMLPPDQLVPLAVWITGILLAVHLIDNILFQPLIFSNSVKAHPLEIFLVILIAGHLAGITGMLVAIPGYTVIRVFAKQFLNNFKVVKKLTEKI
jgi:predicted PurR-regulated permease PerM